MDVPASRCWWSFTRYNALLLSAYGPQIYEEMVSREANLLQHEERVGYIVGINNLTVPKRGCGLVGLDW